MKQGSLESRPDHNQTALAANLLRPALTDLQTGSPDDWGLSATDVAELLRSGSAQLRAATLWVLRHWLSESDTSAEDEWRTTIEPLLARVWPKERACNDASTSQGFIDLVGATEDAFPSAFSFIRHYLVPFPRNSGHVQSIESAQLALKYPVQTLELLWIVCGPPSGRALYDLPKTLGHLVAGAPALEKDRRLLWLDEYAVKR